ncbi:MAG TPA: hypothetical protein VGU72_03750 [Beijerinckiaceae bacterium]|nr:hypothetical protein [Beijerinckiaceae bacterium]
MQKLDIEMRIAWVWQNNSSEKHILMAPMDRQTEDSNSPPSEAQENAQPPVWLHASLSDLVDLDFETPIATSKSADSRELSDLFRTASDRMEDTPARRIFHMLSAVTGMMFKPKDRNEPLGPILVFADGRRSPSPSDFRGEPEEIITAATMRARHPTLRARLADLCWILDRKKGRQGAIAAATYVEIATKIDNGLLGFRFGNQFDALSYEVCDLLRRALQISRAIGWEKPEAIAAREMVAELRGRAIQNGQINAVSLYSNLDLDFYVSDPTLVGKELEELISRSSDTIDQQSCVDLWRLCARAYRYAKNSDRQHHANAATAEQLANMAEHQPSAILAASLLSEAISTLHGIPDKREYRKALRHRLVDIQAGIADEMSSFSHPLDISKIARGAEQAMSGLSLRDKLFLFADLAGSPESPDPSQLKEEASTSIREYPLSSLFSASHHDHEGKVVHRSQGVNLGDSLDDTAIQNQIAQDERLRRSIIAQGELEVARQIIAQEHFLSDDTFIPILLHSPFVPQGLVRTFSRGFLRFFQGDFISGLYILTPLLESSLRHLLKSYSHDVTIFDDATQTQQDRTISSLYEQMRNELDEIFGSSITTDIENTFLTRPGPYLRHALAHGLLHDGNPSSHDAIYGCWLIFRLSLLPLFPYRTQLSLPYDERTS